MTIQVTTVVNENKAFSVIIGVNAAVTVEAKGDPGDKLVDVLQAAASAISNDIRVVNADGTLAAQTLLMNEDGASRVADDPDEVITPGTRVIVNEPKSNG